MEDLGSVNREDLADEDRIVGAYLLHDLSLQLLNESDDIVAERVWHAVRQFSPQLPKRHPEVVRAIRRRNAIPIPEVGRYKLAAEFRKAQHAPVVFAGDYLSTATVEGALRTGRIAADLFCT
jgi:predicted NAD/FAD-dependent oxidoreductase